MLELSNDAEVAQDEVIVVIVGPNPFTSQSSAAPRWSNSGAIKSSAVLRAHSRCALRACLPASLHLCAARRQLKRVVGSWNVRVVPATRFDQPPSSISTSIVRDAQHGERVITFAGWSEKPTAVGVQRARIEAS